MNTEEIIREELRMGSGFENGRIRIYEAIRDRPKKEIPKFLAKEYGIGGWNANGRWCDHNGKGITIQDKGFVDIVSMAWDEVAERLIRLIDNDDYLTEKEKVKVGWQKNVTLDGQFLMF